jgi:hypothetical protein
MFLFRNQFPSFIKYKFVVYNFLVFNLFFMCASQHLIFMEVLNVLEMYITKLIGKKNNSWKMQYLGAWRLFKWTHFFSLMASQIQPCGETWRLNQPTDYWPTWKKKSYKKSWNFFPHHSPCSNCFYFNKPKIVKKCKV